MNTAREIWSLILADPRTFLALLAELTIGGLTP